jgi:hypothetical protein
LSDPEPTARSVRFDPHGISKKLECRPRRTRDYRPNSLRFAVRRQQARACALLYSWGLPWFRSAIPAMRALRPFEHQVNKRSPVETEFRRAPDELALCECDQAEKLLPQPQDFTAFGFLKVKPRFSRPL